MKRKTTFSDIFGQFLSNAISENVVTMATRESLSFQYLFQNLAYIFSGKVTKFQEESFCRFGVMLQKHQGEVKNIPSPLPNRVNEKCQFSYVSFEHTQTTRSAVLQTLLRANLIFCSVLISVIAYLELHKFDARPIEKKP